MGQTVRELGERGLLARLTPYCTGIGDDAALWQNVPPDRDIVITTDVLVDGVHFSDRTTSAEDAGWRAAAANLSDLAAMGATPWGLTIGLGLPPQTDSDWVEGVYRGFAACLHAYGGAIVGGDSVRSPVATLAVAAFGLVPRDRAIHRSHARVGDRLWISGAHGLSRAGLAVLLDPAIAEGIDPVAIAQAVRAHRRPVPRLDVVGWVQQHADRAAGADSSDGLADAIARICEASGVGAQIDWRAIPLPPALRQIAGDRALEWALYGGEDFELVLSVPAAAAEQLARRFPGSAIVGQIVAGNGVDGIELARTFQHF